MRKVDDGKKEKKKRMSFLVATNVIASRPPEQRPTDARAIRHQQPREFILACCFTFIMHVASGERDQPLSNEDSYPRLDIIVITRWTGSSSVSQLLSAWATPGGPSTGLTRGWRWLSWQGGTSQNMLSSLDNRLDCLNNDK